MPHTVPMLCHHSLVLTCMLPYIKGLNSYISNVQHFIVISLFMTFSKFWCCAQNNVSCSIVTKACATNIQGRSFIQIYMSTKYHRYPNIMSSNIMHNQISRVIQTLHTLSYECTFILILLSPTYIPYHTISISTV